MSARCRWGDRRWRKPRFDRLFPLAPALLIPALVLGLAMPALAQTPQEAAAINARLAIEICARNYRTPDEIRPAFEAAGFAYTQEDLGGGPGDVLHWYAAPADTVSAAVLFPGPDQAECRVTTDHMDVAEALPFARAVFETMFAGQIQDGAPEGQDVRPGSVEAQVDFCSGFHVFAPQKVIWVQLARAGNDGTCQSDGTASINIKM